MQGLYGGVLGIKEVSLLVTLGVGYGVCYLASKTDKRLKTIGYVIGIFIIAVSGILILKDLLLVVRFCGRGKSAMMTPYHQRMMRERAPLVAPEELPR